MVRTPNKELDVALELFNSELKKLKSLEKEQAVIKKAERKKADAVKALQEAEKNPDLSSEEKAQAILKQAGVDIDAVRADPNKFLARRFKAEGGSMKEPVAKKTMPLLDMGGQEMDLRAEGGFVPIGKKERADDVPARLSKNEFVMTADAVRAAGGGSVNEGAKRMYDVMNKLEARA